MRLRDRFPERLSQEYGWVPSGEGIFLITGYRGRSWRALFGCTSMNGSSSGMRCGYLGNTRPSRRYFSVNGQHWSRVGQHL
jgi:hypothetical protein